MKRRYTLFVSIVLAFLLTFSGCINTGPVPIAGPKPIPPVTSSSALADIEATLEQIYNQVNPSVVNIGVLIGLNTTFPQDATGSGFIWDKEGHIVTNNHLITHSD